MNRRAVLLCTLLFLGTAAVAPAAGGDEDSGVVSRRSTRATGNSGPAPLHNGPARAARRRKVHADRQARAGARAASASGDLPPVPPVDDNADSQQPGRPKLRAPGSHSAKRRRGAKRRLQADTPSKPGGRVRVASAVKIAAAKPAAATQLPQFADLYVKAKAKTVSAILQKLVKVSGKAAGKGDWQGQAVTQC